MAFTHLLHLSEQLKVTTPWHACEKKKDSRLSNIWYAMLFCLICLLSVNCLLLIFSMQLIMFDHEINWARNHTYMRTTKAQKGHKHTQQKDAFKQAPLSWTWAPHYTHTRVQTTFSTQASHSANVVADETVWLLDVKSCPITIIWYHIIEIHTHTSIRAQWAHTAKDMGRIESWGLGDRKMG